MIEILFESPVGNYWVPGRFLELSPLTVFRMPGRCSAFVCLSYPFKSDGEIYVRAVERTVDTSLR